MKDKQIVFAFYKDGELQGFRADTFNTISMRPKLYTYSQSQVKSIIDNIQDCCGKRSNSEFMKFLEKTHSIPDNEFSLVAHVSKSEKQLREWNEFEVRVLEFTISREEMRDMEDWKMKVKIQSLPEPLEIHKFKIVEYEN